MPGQKENNRENNKVNNQEAPQDHAATGKPGLIPQNELNEINRVIAVMSGKGGVGKSLREGEIEEYQNNPFAQGNFLSLFRTQHRLKN